MPPLGLLASVRSLLVGSLPIAYLAGGGSTALHLDARQVEEFLLTATQTLLGVAALLALRFPPLGRLDAARPVRSAVRPARTDRPLRPCGIYAAIALTALIRNRRHLWPTLAAPFRRAPEAVTEADHGEQQPTVSAVHGP